MSLPFAGEEFTFTNPDNTTIRVRGWGNDFYAVFETVDGFTVIQDPVSGFYHYAKLSADKSSLESTGVKVGETDPRSLGLPQHIRISPEAAKRRGATARAQGPQRRWEVRRAEKKRTLAAAIAARAAGAAPPPGQTVGNYVGLCLLICFPDVPAAISQAEISNFCNQSGYTGFGNNGSVRDYFYDVSGGRLTYTNVVTAYYTAAHDRSYYTDRTIPYGTRARELIVEALNNLVAQGFNFAQLSSDSAGYIYALNVFYAGAVTNNWAEGLWPHSWALASDYNVGGGKKLHDYQITNIGDQLTLATFCHENGHMVCDFPDFYDYGYESYGVGNFSLMAYGGNGKNPVQVDAYLKLYAGWAKSLTPITPGMNARISAGQNDFFIFRRNNQTEFFLIENRQQIGRDASLPDAGLAIWHIDTVGSNNNEQMTPTSHYECSLEQADGRFDLEHGANAGDGGDLFAAPTAMRLADDTTPNSHWWDGTPSGLIINQISASGPTMTFTTPAVVQQAASVPYELLLLD